MNLRIPAYFYNKGNIIRLILFTAIFALLFINIFQPFGSRGWYPNISDFSYFFFSSLIILTGMLVVVISRIIMLLYTKKNPILYWQYACWVLAEILAMSLFYSLFAKFIPEGGHSRDFMEILKQSTFNTSLVILLPYAISWLYLSWKDKNAKLQEMATKEEPEVNRKTLIGFSDEKGELKLSVMLDNVLYIDSADNYITVHYLNKLKLSHFVVRNTLKHFEETQPATSPFVRCHRSYAVNLDRIKVLRKTKDGIFLELDTENTPDIPVSKTYYETVMKQFSKYSV